MAQGQVTLLGPSDGSMYVKARCCMGQTVSSMGHVRLGAADSKQLTQFVDPRADKCHQTDMCLHHTQLSPALTLTSSPALRCLHVDTWPHFSRDYN